MFVAPLSASMSFAQAADSFLQSRIAPVSIGRARYVSKRTFRDYQYYLKTLSVFFGQLKLEDIHVGHLAEYERRRSAGDGFTRVIGNRKGGAPVPSPAGPNKIRSELQLLTRIMRKAGCWPDSMKENYIPLQQVDNDIPRALSIEDQDRFLSVASSHPDWHIVWWYSLVAEHTSFSSDEMRTIRIGDVNLTHQTLSVNRRYGKNSYRRRSVPVESGACLWALTRLLERARELGATDPQHFLFPFRVKKGTWDANQPMGETGIRKPFDAVRKAAHLDWFKLNGWRHTAITNLALSGMKPHMIMERAGHMTWKMTQHYTHISEQAQRRAVRESVEFHRKPPTSIGRDGMYRGMTG